ncbi:MULTISPECIES: hypothetical protein [Symmachiella]|jgi:hypothetical protein|uniref:Uncharacterized protein n=2 Tax=Symmachiella TaxID=2795780 RepID=A0A517ZPR0_9PLAN|nr:MULTISPECIES: hypothetical protein [Symmachiella]QDT48846.1 hypothetical protein Pan258_28920 [Symmachiella dynata]QDU44475.1 hypothetical protein Mal52_29570 [Symmachiella dynata]TWU08664.1 hypothetical protein CA54_39000 [Symmachiella macrocystis]|tara:strand:+ start:956 stop:1225 length:270 start_codon:yes stop_codon:yes gene_type:complete
MKALRHAARPVVALVGCALMTCTFVGCQTSVGGQTLPSAYYLRDDMQYYPHGPEDQLTNQINAIEQYKLEQAGLAEGIDIEPPAPQPGN